MKSKKIYCLQLMMGWHDSGYRIEELEAWFSIKPTAKNLMDYFEVGANDQKSINAINKLLSGESVKIDFSVYRLEQIEEYTFEE